MIVWRNIESQQQLMTLFNGTPFHILSISIQVRYAHVELLSTASTQSTLEVMEQLSGSMSIQIGDQVIDCFLA